MAKIDLFQTLKGQKTKVEKADFKTAVMDLAQSMLGQDSLTEDEKIKLARLKAYIDIHFK
jgi:hypothetical protein